MITKKLLSEYLSKGIKSFRFDASGPIVQVNDYECELLELDIESGGIWYQLVPKKMPIPFEQGKVYVSPNAIRAIQFKE